MSLSLGALRLAVAWPEALALAAAVAWLAGRWEAGAGGTRAAIMLRTTIAGLVALALARPALEAGGAGATLVLADQSGSVAAGALAAAEAGLGLPRAGVGRLAFGDGRDSPLGAALDLARRALPQGGRVIVLSDGRATDGDAVASAAQARAAGVAVDVVPLAPRGGRDVAVTHVDAPPAWRAGDVIPVTVEVRSTTALSATLTLLANDRIVRRVAVAASPAGSAFAFRHPVADERDVRFEARVEAAGDDRPANDAAYAATHIAPPPRVLVVGDGPGAVVLLDTLRAQGFGAQVLAPERLPSRLSAIEAWDTLVLVDVAAGGLGLDQLAAVEAFAADLGRGVVLTGGPRSYLLGGWEGTPLADLAPVRLDPPAREERDAVALALLIDQSASMGSLEGRGRISKLDLAREAALLAADVLHPGDRIGIVAYDDAARWLVPWTTVGTGRALAEIEARLGMLTTGGGTRLLAALDLGLPALADLPGVPIRHAVLITDGRDVNPDAAAYAAAIDAAHAAGVTLSTIAIGADVDRDLLARLARLGHGRFHAADDPADLPQLALAESEIVRARAEQAGAFHPSVPAAGPHPSIGGLDIAALPPLTGYLAMRPRDGAAVALEARDGDPLLAVWNYGRGRVAAWTSDAGEAWAAAWAGDQAATAFWARIVRHVARSPEAGPPGVAIESLGPDRVRVDVDARDPAGRPIDLADVRLAITTTTGITTTALPQTAPGRYGGVVALPGPGAFPAAVEVRSPTQGTFTAPAPLAWRAPDEEIIAGDGRALLAAVADAGGGRVIESGPGALPAAADTRIDLWPWLLAAAAVLWGLEVARQTLR